MNICYHKIANKQMTDYLGDSLFEDQTFEMLYYDRIDIGEGIDPTKSNRSKEFMICRYYFFNHGFKFQNFVCNGPHDLIMLSVNTSDLAIITVKNVDYRCIIYDITKSEAIIYQKALCLKIVVIYKKYCLNFQYAQDNVFFFTFFVLLYIKWLLVNILQTPVNL